MSDKADEKEVWKQYPDYDFIEVSNLGNIRTIDHWVTYKNGARHFYKGHILKQWLLPNGYMFVHFNVNNKIVNLSVHRAVAITYIPNKNNLPEVNHIDCDPTNNRWDNLEWCTHEYNIAYREKYGTACSCPVSAVNLRTGKILYFESQHEAARQLGVDRRDIKRVLKGEQIQAGSYWFTEDENEITEEKIREIKAKKRSRLHPVIAVKPETSEVFWIESQSEAARNLGANQSKISRVVKGKRNKTHGYWFCNADETAIEKTRKKFGDDIASKVEKLIRQNQ